MLNIRARSVARTAGKVAWHVILPFSAMKRTAVLFKAEAEQRKDEIAALREWRRNAKATSAKSDLAFEAALRARANTAMSEQELYRFFLKHKRVALGTSVALALPGLLAIAIGLHGSNLRGVALGALSLFVTQPIFFVAALGAQLRLWQLRTRRLSKAERGGLADFINEERGWWRATLNPELGHGKEGKR
ncbi:conserved hypothetical protein [Burkholderia diffusa]|uniref:hypothetical protein n=1 Tax=Burkholderia diffusa TaxID=488732 RepID=UPI001CB354F3|nr:hypothetical protein [Burkholderia diffusa]CAG9260908.1 conserved hypothetical protein [Burkholderia diffusa]